MNKLLMIAVLLSLTGCATCEKHATACWVATGIAAGCIAASTNHRASDPIDPAICGVNRSACK